MASPVITRRRLLKAGLAGGALLVGYAAFRSLESSQPLDSNGRLSTETKNFWAAVVPIILAGALPDGAEREVAIGEILDNIESIHRALRPSVSRPLAQLYGLLINPVTRGPLTGVWSDWPNAEATAVQSFLESWSRSHMVLKRSAYDAFRNFSLSAWYGNPRSWRRIGYPGPPF